jgi:hypothetical protein
MNSEYHNELHLPIALPAEVLILFNITNRERIPLEFEIVLKNEFEGQSISLGCLVGERNVYLSIHLLWSIEF